MKIYKKEYTRENCLIAIEIWEEQQCRLLKEKLGENVPLTIFDAYEGVVEVLYDKNIHEIWFRLIMNKAKEEKDFIPKTMKWFGENLDKLEKIWKAGKINSRDEIVEFFYLAAWSWIGLSVAYWLPEMKDLSTEDQDLGMSLRIRSAEFLEDTDHVLQNSLRDLYPGLGELVKYISIQEVKDNKIPDSKILEERKKHYIYYNFQIYTDTDVNNLASNNGIEIQNDIIPEVVRSLKGQIASKGKVTGKVRVLYKKSEISDIQDGEILVTAMTTPDYLPAMNKAAGFVTDEGGITCHAAIVAREMNKPCIIGTNIATKALKTGDLVEVDATKGVVTIIETVNK